MTPSLPKPALDKTEWNAVAVVLEEVASCGCGAGTDGVPAGLMGRIVRAMIGGGPAALEDPRLEAVRRFVCATHRRRTPAFELAEDLATQGFSRAQIDAIALLSM
jgi:hypothetical protein